jgi:hypothetical protein
VVEKARRIPVVRAWRREEAISDEVKRNRNGPSSTALKRQRSLIRLSANRNSGFANFRGRGIVDTEAASLINLDMAMKRREFERRMPQGIDTTHG